MVLSGLVWAGLVLPGAPGENPLSSISFDSLSGPQFSPSRDTVSLVCGSSPRKGPWEHSGPVRISQGRLFFKVS